MTSLFFNNLLDWDRDFYSFTRPIKDIFPYEIIKNENHSTIVFNAVGLDKESISVKFDKTKGTDYLLISGEKKNEVTNKTYSVNGRFVVDINEIDTVDWRITDGLLYVNIYFKKAEQPKINIKYKD